MSPCVDGVRACPRTPLLHGFNSPQLEPICGGGELQCPPPQAFCSLRLTFHCLQVRLGLLCSLGSRAPVGSGERSLQLTAHLLGSFLCPLLLPSFLFFSEHFPNKLLAQKSPSQYGAFVPRGGKTMEGEHAHASKSFLNSYYPRESLSNCSL